MDVIDQAQQDLARGDLDGARGRLYDALGREPASQPILELLAYTYLVMGDRASAGAAWFLTSKADDDPTAASAFAALEARHGSAIGVARALPINAPSEYYPVQAQDRLERLVAVVRNNGQDWVPPRDTVYFDETGVDSDDFLDDDFPDGGSALGRRSMQQRVVAAFIIVAVVATSASVVLALVFS